MVFNNYLVMGFTMRLDVRRVDVETGRVLKTAKMTADAAVLTGYLAAAKDAGVLLFKE